MRSIDRLVPTAFAAVPGTRTLASAQSHAVVDSPRFDTHDAAAYHPARIRTTAAAGQGLPRPRPRPRPGP